MPAIVIIGAQWGDEGKGRIVDHIAKRTCMVVRYQGGNNAGHTVVIGDKTFKLHQVPAGIMRKGVAAVLGNGMVINPLALVEELDTLQAEGIPIEDIYISSNAHVIMPYHLLLDALEEKQRGAACLGTTLRGIGPAYADKYARCGLRMQDLWPLERFEKRVAEVLPRVNLELEGVFKHEPLTVKEIVDAYAGVAERLAPFVTDTSLLVNNALDKGETVLMEGAQATMLDIDFGTYPYVTSSSPTAGGACQGAGVSPVKIGAVLGVVKVYTSRVGTGPFPTELLDETGDWIVEKGQEYGTTTGRRRRCGWIDLVSLRYATRINGFTDLALTRLDVLSGLDEVKLCVAYEMPDGSITRDYPLNTDTLAQVKPVYEAMPGWSGNLHAARSLTDLPETARNYCIRVSELLGVKLDMVSVGAERDDLIVNSWPIN